jgi:5-methylcytosine-specific restriction enzyme A
MGKLTAIKPALPTLAPRVGYAPGDEQGGERQRRDTQPWRAWYKTARWQKLRREVLTRDGMICQRSGVLCLGTGSDPSAPVVNHIRPHKGDPALFWNIDNLETVQKQVHDSDIQREERRAEHPRN